MYNKLELIKIGMYNNSFKMREGHELRIRFEKIHKNYEQVSLQL